ncbi:MAG: Wzz/FepE/Etk N-terminal domain-containing protein, partial [Geminicoccaceae bacterium]
MANEAMRLIGTSAEVGSPTAGGELDLRELWRALRRRRLVLLATVLLVTGGAYALVSQQTELYSAGVLIHVKPREAQVVQIPGVVDQMIADPATIESEITLLSSPAFHRRVVEKLGLVQDPEFNAALRKDEEQSFLDLINPLRYVPKEWIASLTNLIREPAPERAPATDPGTAELNRVVRTFGSRAEVAQVGRSYVIGVSFLSAEPTKAAHIANSIAEEYLSSQVQAKYAAINHATDWLTERIKDLRGKVLEAEAKIVEYRTKHHLVDTTQNNP